VCRHACSAATPPVVYGMTHGAGEAVCRAVVGWSAMCDKLDYHRASPANDSRRTPSHQLSPANEFQLSRTGPQSSHKQAIFSIIHRNIYSISTETDEASNIPYNGSYQM